MKRITILASNNNKVYEVIDDTDGVHTATAIAKHCTGGFRYVKVVDNEQDKVISFVDKGEQI